MKILITNNDLSTRSGSELYVQEVAGELLRRGHTVAAYSTHIGKLGQEMNESGIETINDLSRLSWVPDLIHGQHHLETMTALTRFPGVPAIYLCHGYRPWQEKPPLHPRIMHYYAVDYRTLNHAVTHGVPREKIQLIHNFVDLCRFKQRTPLPERPKKALVFNNVAHISNYLPLVRKACSKAGISLEIIGSASGQISVQPENILKDYDLVFAVGRCAQEALATGAAVVICNDCGVGPLVASKDMHRLRDLNFGIAAMYSKPDADTIYNELLKYDATDSALLTTNLRAIIGIDQAVNKLEYFYSSALETYRSANIGEENEASALSAYLKNMSVFIKYELGQRDHKIVQLRNELDSKMSRFWILRDIYRKLETLFHKSA